MGIAEDFFRRYTPDYNKLEEYGFVLKGKSFSCEKIFFDNKFKAVLKIAKSGKISDTVYDIENDDEFLPLKIKYNEGSFVADVKTAYLEILSEIREKCFIKNYFINSQSNRITNRITEKYGNHPEFLWEKYDGSGVFRNSETNKWYGAMLEVNWQKLDKQRSGNTEVLNIKLEPDEIVELIHRDGFYPAYHMNKKYWISVIMEDVVPDETVMELVEKSYQFTLKNKHC